MKTTWVDIDRAPVGVAVEVYDGTKTVARRTAILLSSGTWHPVANGSPLINVKLAPSHWRRLTPPAD